LTLPRLDEYQDAIQNPRNSFKDPELQSCKVEINPLGLPAVKSGGFALIYHLFRKEHWAVRCFYREIGDLRYRYDAISRFLEKNADGTFVKATLQPDGILVGGSYYPILVMPWLTGDVLNLHIERNLSKPSEIAWLADAFLKMVNHLEQLGVAHGDLQHGNMMVRNNALTLIDYDGMYLPELSKSPAKVLGHLNYIHPDRPNVPPSAQIDRFPSIVIYLGLRAVAAAPSLWRKYSGGENILFQRKDFLDPLSSPLINELKQIPALATLAEKFQAVCFLDFDKTPSLSEFITLSYSPPKPVGRVRVAPPLARPVEYITQYEVVLAENTSALTARVGEKLEVVGQITDFKKGVTQRNQPYMFLNFGDWRQRGFYLVMWADGLDMMQTSGIRPESLVRKWVSITGMITEYNGRPQLVIEIPSQIQPLPSKQAALQRVNTQKRAGAAPQATPRTIIPSKAKPQATPYQRHAPQPQPDVLSRQQADALQRLYASTTTSPVKTPIRPPLASPRLFWAGASLTLIAIVLTLTSGLGAVIIVLMGLGVTYWGAVYRSYLVPVRILSGSFVARYRGRCRKCGRVRRGELIVKTDAGYMHSHCAQTAKRRIWKKENQIRLPKLRAVLRTVTITRPRKRVANILSLAILGVAVLSISLMSYPAIPYASTTIRTSASSSTYTSFTTSIHQVLETVTASSTSCSSGNGDRGGESCRTYVPISTSTTAHTTTQNLGAYVQTHVTSYTNSFTSVIAPYASLGINSNSWLIAVSAIVIVGAVAVVLARRT